MFKWLKSLFTPTEEEKQFYKALHKLYQEYDVRISPRGGISKTSKPEYAEKHRKELAEAFPEIREEIRKTVIVRLRDKI